MNRETRKIRELKARHDPMPRRVQDLAEFLDEADRARRTPIASFIWVQVGKIRIQMMPDGLWLRHQDGEAMQCGTKTEAKLAKLLEKFFNKEF